MAALRFHRSLAGRLLLLSLIWVTVAVVLALWLQSVLADSLLAGALSLLLTLPLAAAATRGLFAPWLALFRAISGQVLSYRDGEFNTGLNWSRGDELDALVLAHHELGDVLREQRLRLVQRELLLDTMVQNTPVAMLLIADGGASAAGSEPSRPIVFGNLAARRLLHGGRKLEGIAFEALLQGTSAALRDALARGGDGLFSVGEDDDEQVYHLARRRFLLNNRPHELLLLRTLTSELRRQEVQTWKKVIRVISHELNNSLAPIASLAHSGAELARRGQVDKLGTVFATIEERARHLEGFIRGYARFAKLPQPRREPLHWPSFIERLQSQIGFSVDGELPTQASMLDLPQVEQALINLLKNAHESGTAAEDVRLRVLRMHDGLRVEVMDRGTGMNEAVLANALVPFYSTKRSGTGLGLALAREIAEAHGGRIGLANREGGGLCVSLVLPD